LPPCLDGGEAFCYAFLKKRKAGNGMNIVVVDAQGGGVGRQLVTAIKTEIPGAVVTAVGTNSAATSAMLKAGADFAATGENALIVAARKAEVIVGPIGIVLADAMLGEITPAMAAAVAQSPAKRVLIPFNHCDTLLVGVPDFNISRLIALAVEELKKIAQN